MGCSSSKNDVKKTSIVPGGGGSKNGDNLERRNSSGVESLMETTMKLKKIKKEKNVRAKELVDEEEYVPPEKVNKPSRVEKLLLDTMKEHWLFNDMDMEQLQGLVDVMSQKLVNKGENVIKQGDDGKEFYIISRGTCSVTVDDKLLQHKMTKGSAFGDLALFYEAPRSATITATENCQLWSLDQITFRHRLKKRTKDYVDSNIKFLNTIKEFENVGEKQIIKLANAMNSVTFKKDDYIVKQGDAGNVFYILKSGTCKIVENDVEKDHTMEAGDYFGETALVTNDVRTASVIASSDKVECAGIDRETFEELLGTYNQFKTLKKGEVIKGTLNKTVPHMELKELKELAKSKEVYALKKMQKQAIVDAEMQLMIVNEKNFLVEMSSPFVLAAKGTASDTNNVYIVLEFLQGGDLFGLLEQKGIFNDKYARFYIACTVMALSYVHSRDIAFRDLKLENLVLDGKGYCKLVDFGLAKRVPNRTFTVCGSPRYCAPEMVTNKGHNYAVDYWALGIILYECLFAESPFASEYDDHLETFRNIARKKLIIPDEDDVSDDAKDIIKELCQKKPLERLGCKAEGPAEVKNHPWYSAAGVGFDWDKLENQTMVPPWKPKVKNVEDASNFGEVEIYEEHLTELKYKKKNDPKSGWDDHF
eukprot:g12094.t1